MSRLNFLLISLALFCASCHHCRAQTASAGFTLEPIGSVTIPLTTDKMTNIVFPTAIRPGLKVSPDIKTLKPKGTTNVLVLRAGRRGFAPTNLSVYGLDGRLYSFDLRYEEVPAKLNFRVNGAGVKDEIPLERDAAMIEKMRFFMHKSADAEKIRLTLHGIYLQDGLMWFSLSLTNHSQIAYFPELIRWVIKDRRELKRTAVQEIVLTPEYRPLLQPLPGDSSRMLIVGFQPFTLAKSKELLVEMLEQDGGRDLLLAVRPADLLKAKSLKNAVK